MTVTAPALLAELAKAPAEWRPEEWLAFYTKPELLIVDELGYNPFFQLVALHSDYDSLPALG